MLAFGQLFRQLLVFFSPFSSGVEIVAARRMIAPRTVSLIEYRTVPVARATPLATLGTRRLTQR